MAKQSQRKDFYMSRVWILGDSFAETVPEKDYLWTIQLGQLMKKDVSVISANGAAGEWLMFKWNQLVVDDIKFDDFLVIIVPFWDRVCIWPEKPQLSKPLTLIDPRNSNDPLWSDISYEERKAFRDYFLYLENQNLIELRTKSWLNWVNNSAEKLEIKPLIINVDNKKLVDDFSLRHCAVANGFLETVCENEFTSIEIWRRLTEKALFCDFRIGHISESNHKILAEKIFRYFSHGVIPDLTSGFEANFIDDDYIRRLT